MSRRESLDWIDNLPAEWSAVQLNYLLVSGNDAMKVGPFGTQLSGNDFTDDGYWVYNQRTVVDQNFEDNNTFVSEEKYNAMKSFQVEAGDILITTRGTIGRICKVPEHFHRGIIHPCIIKFRIDENKILYDLVRLLFNESDMIKEQLVYMSNATTIDVVYSGPLKNVFIPVAPIKTQRSISAYLDAKCSEIDALTADIQSQIETLEQYKRSVITEAVTKGLDPDVEMRDSGFEWLGFIPSTWQTRKGKYIFVQRNERGNSIELQLLSPTQKYGVIPQDLYEEISGYKAVKLDEKTDYSLLKTIHKGDYCISLRSFQGGFEYSEYEGVVSPAYQVFYPVIEVFRGYYKHLFKTQIFIDKMNSFTMSLRDGKNIAFADFGNTYLPIPPIQEQQQIADYLDSKCAEIDSIITEKKQQIETIEEYKKSLIFEYVTGKKEVPAV